ncbi:hypothetical protein HMPREF9104_01100 [Lentilactobacillus kisonensis F0435]|uniref:Uncharacterized protein n=1 Tax=Lentilactobacillus kisonensis F0435 TaxID=797516 RepID=H1LES4_9LACO|nr:hypothetical protein HMPREF9104_01100 [Lentilactobacillus kisonensis F0435]
MLITAYNILFFRPNCKDLLENIESYPLKSVETKLTFSDINRFQSLTIIHKQVVHQNLS